MAENGRKLRLNDLYVTFKAKIDLFSPNYHFHLIPWPPKNLKSGIIYYFDIFSFLGKINYLAYFFDPWAEEVPQSSWQTT